MRIVNGNVTGEILSAAVSLLRRSVPELTAHNLVAALKSYNPEAESDERTRETQRKIERLYTVSEVADILRLSKMSVLRLFYSGKLAGKKVGGRVWRVPANALEAFLEAPPSETEIAAEE